MEVLDAKTELDAFCVKYNFPGGDSLPVILEEGVGIGGMILEGEISDVNLEFFDDGKLMSIFCCRCCCCSGNVAAICRRDCDDGGAPLLELGGVGVAQAALLPA